MTDNSDDRQELDRRALEVRREARSWRGRLAIHIAGWGFLVLGVLGIVLPILQGFLFLLIGLYVLSFEADWAARVRQWLVERFPEAGRRVLEAETRALAWYEKHRKRWTRARTRA